MDISGPSSRFIFSVCGFLISNELKVIKDCRLRSRTQFQFLTLTMQVLPTITVLCPLQPVVHQTLALVLLLQHSLHTTAGGGGGGCGCGGGGGSGEPGRHHTVHLLLLLLLLRHLLHQVGILVPGDATDVDNRKYI